ncbi:DUF3549 family protein [Pseudidiomarina andamanensis]|nr:DUF3549 family protein [Pseudidiomarina andamanensis]MDS0218170.1 DUF3549 family protein [Pseudidiomarina andamanensis]
MTMTNLAELLSESHSDYLVYDLGRRVQAIDTDTFNAICAQQRPYPYPLQDQAWFAVVFWPKLRAEQPEPFLWFLKMPLDERGLLDHAAQQEFMAHVIALLGQQITGALTSEQEQQLQQSAYLFTPSEAKRAAIHAQLTAGWNRPPSRYFNAALEELQSPTESGWQHLGLQGIHDVAARLKQHPESTQAIAAHFENYPDALQNALAEALEHTQPPQELADKLLTLVNAQQQQLRLNVLRALAGFANTPQLQTLLAQRMAVATADELVIIVARLWPALCGNAELMEAYLVRVAELNNAALFGGIVRDLLRLPETRIFTLGLVQRNDLPVALYQAWQQFIGANS